MVNSRIGIIAVLLSLVSYPAFSHEGHSHGDEAPPPTIITAPRATAASTQFELVAIADGAALTIYIDRFNTNEPVKGATVSVETPAGPATATVDDDVYQLAALWATEPGDRELLFTVEAGADIDFLTATLSIPTPVVAPPEPDVGRDLIQFLSKSSRSEAVKMAALGGTGFLLGLAVMALRRRRILAGGVAVTVLAVIATTSVVMAETTAPIVRDVAQRLPAGRIFAPKAAQRILAIRTVPTEEAEHRRIIEMAGRIIPDPNASGFVQTAVGGRLAPPPEGFPVLGSKVQKGQLMALVEPSLAAADQSSIRQTKAELDQEIALGERQLD